MREEGQAGGLSWGDLGCSDQVLIVEGFVYVVRVSVCVRVTDLIIRTRTRRVVVVIVRAAQ
jgi:hypothetical protein